MDQSHESLNVIEDDLDYVLVGGPASSDPSCGGGGSLLLHLLDDDSSWDNCNLSRTLSCATSVATNLTLNLVEGDEGMDCDDEECEEEESGGRVEFDLEDDEEECGGGPEDGAKVARRARSDSMQSCSSAATQSFSNLSTASSWRWRVDFTRGGSTRGGNGGADLTTLPHHSHWSSRGAARQPSCE